MTKESLLNEIDKLIQKNYHRNEMNLGPDSWLDHPLGYWLSHSGHERDFIIENIGKEEYDTALYYCLNTINDLRFLCVKILEQINKNE